MKPPPYFNASILASVLFLHPAIATEPEWVTQSRSAAQTLASELQQTLQAAMVEQGPIGAIDVCKIEAPAIATAASTDSLIVSRTALKIRNPDNEPDAWEHQVLLDFQRQLANGADASQLEAFTIETDTSNSDRKTIGRWMRAIPTQPQCLVCHGPALAPDVTRAIDQAYPEDAARDFNVGELRGAFSVRVTLPSKQSQSDNP